MNELTIYPVLLEEAERSVRNLKKGLKVLDLSPEKQTWINFLCTSENDSNPVEIDEIHTAYKKMKITTGSAALFVGINLVLIRIEITKKLLGKRQLLFKMDKLKAIDLENAKEEGKEEGLAEGLEKGAYTKMNELALNMKNQGLDKEFIAKCLNISIDELKKLLNE